MSEFRDGFDPKKAATWNAEERAVYRTGFEEGNSDVEVDWYIALDELLPKTVSPFPTAVAAYIARLQREKAAWRQALHDLETKYGLLRSDHDEIRIT